MVEEGYGYDEIAAQIGRTAAACKAMYNLLTKRNVMGIHLTPVPQFE
jgi:hypothetical protein